MVRLGLNPTTLSRALDPIQRSRFPPLERCRADSRRRARPLVGVPTGDGVDDGHVFVEQLVYVPRHHRVHVQQQHLVVLALNTTPITKQQPPSAEHPTEPPSGRP
eukprot:3699670-Pyramimonas_sp.AAC.1